VQPVAVFFLALPMVPLNLMVNLMVYSRLVTLWLFNIAMENGPFIDGYLLQMVIFHGYVKYPDGIIFPMEKLGTQNLSSDPESHPKVGFESVSGFGFRVSGFVD